MPNLSKLFVDRVRARLTELKKSQAELAHNMGVKASLIGRLLSEKNAQNANPKLNTIEAIAAALDTQPWELIRPDDASIPAPTRRAGDHLSPAHQRMIEIVSHMTDAEVLALLHCWESVAEIMARAERGK